MTEDFSPAETERGRALRRAQLPPLLGAASPVSPSCSSSASPQRGPH